MSEVTFRQSRKDPAGRDVGRAKVEGPQHSRLMAYSKILNPDQGVQRKAKSQTNNTGLPDSLKSGLESLSGISMDDVRVHRNSAKPAQLNAHGFAQGKDIHLGPGQDHYLPHEAWHVVQQAQGRVKPTMQMKGGVPVNDDHALEREADVMGAKAVNYEGEAFGSSATVTTGPMKTAQLMTARIRRTENREPTADEIAEARRAAIANSRRVAGHGRRAHGHRLEAPAARVERQAAEDLRIAIDRTIQLKSIGMNNLRPVQFESNQARAGAVVQRSGPGVDGKTGFWGGAATGGIAGAIAGYKLAGGGMWGLAGGLAGGLFGGLVGGLAGGTALKSIGQVRNRRGFGANLAGRAEFNREMEGLVNKGAVQGLGDKITLNRLNLAEASRRMDERETEQRGYVRGAVRDGTSLYEDNAVGREKDALWRSMHAAIDAGTKKADETADMSDNVKLKAKTSLAQIIGTDAGQALMTYVTETAADLGITIRYVESAAAEPFNLQVASEYEGDDRKGRLNGLRVILPSNERYSEGQSFKRVNTTGAHDRSDMGVKGNRVSVSPIDTDFYHEFVHAAHYLKFEQRRRNAEIAGSVHDVDSYDHATKDADAESMLGRQDDVSEARTIHRQNSFGDLTDLTREQDLHERGTEHEKYFTEMHRSMGHIGHVTDDMWSENEYRRILGLAPRQDHKALGLASPAKGTEPANYTATIDTGISVG